MTLLKTRQKMQANRYTCYLCGNDTASIRPQDPALHRGEGRCSACRHESAKEIVLLRLAGCYLTLEQAQARIAKYA